MHSQPDTGQNSIIEAMLGPTESELRAKEFSNVSSSKDRDYSRIAKESDSATLIDEEKHALMISTDGTTSHLMAICVA